MKRERRLAAQAKAYDQWVKANPKADIDNPTPEDEADLMRRMIEADPDISGKGWAAKVAKMSQDEIDALLRLREYGGTE